MRRAARCLAALAMLALLAACAGRPVRGTALLAGPGLAAALARQEAHEAWVLANDAWALEGRVALSNGRDGGSGRIEWTQRAGHYDVSLSAPVTRQSWRLSGDGQGATLEGLAGGTRRGDDPAALLHAATRWEIPVEALSAWVRGARADAGRHGEASLDFGLDGRPLHLRQAGWNIAYTAWSDAGAMPLPTRLEARRGDALVRLVVDAWQRDPR